MKTDLGYRPEDILQTINNSNLVTFRQIYERKLEQSQQEQFAEQQIQEAISQSLLNLSFEEKNDMGWLTDDNIEYILKNDEITSSVSNVQIKTDLANIYLQLQKAKNGEEIDNDFWNSLDTNKKYIILPLTVSGNHWSMLLFVNNEVGKVSWIYYISSLGLSAAEQEVKEIESFLKKVGKKFGTTGSTIINENNLSEMVFQQNPRQPNTWDCGVYLRKFIQFLCVDEYYNLNETSYRITEQELSEFRNKWKAKIGEEKWCKWDTNQPSKSVGEENDAELQEALKFSLLTNETDALLQEALLLSSQQQEQEGDQETEILRKELAVEKAKNELLSKKLELFELISQLKTKLDDKELLDNFLKLYEEYLKNKQGLISNGIVEQEINQFCQLQEEIINLEKQLENLQSSQQIAQIQQRN